MFALAGQVIAGKISGTVSDADGEPLPGANIIIEGTSLGAAADTDGDYFILNVPQGNYDVSASMIGYQKVVKSDVRVLKDLTVKVDFTLKSSALEGEEVVIESYRKPPVQKDLTFKTQSMSNLELRDMPANEMSRVLEKQAGVTRDIQTTPVNSRPVFGQFASTPSDGLHFRGGRSNETLYLFDGIDVRDGIWGDFNMDAMGELSYEYMETLTGTFSPKYGEAMSGVFNISPRDNTVDKTQFYIKSYTDQLGVEETSHNTMSFEAMMTVPIRKNLTLIGSIREYSTDGYINGYIYPNYRNSEGQDKSGNPTEVPMQFRDSQFGFSKLIWKATDNVKLSVGGFKTTTHKGVYNHFFKYNPYGTPRPELSSELGYLKYNQVLSERTFFEVSIARYNRYFDSHVYDSPEKYEVVPQNSTGEFSYSGEDWVYFKSRFYRNEFQFDFTSQVSKMHKIMFGATGDLLQTYYARRNPDGFTALERYDLEPRKYSGYLTDKMEFEEMGLIINAGLRYDHVDPNRKFTESINNPQDSLKWVDPKTFVSPRFGISYPVTDAAAFRFGYGHYYQYPSFYKAYQGLNTEYDQWRVDVTQVSGAIARGDIQEEHTVNYEAGVQAKVSQNISLDVTGFYRKTSNLIGVQVVSDANDRRFPVFDNINFATVKGFEVSLDKRMSNNFSGFINYTYSKTLVSSSVVFEQAQDVARTFPADWDQPHVLNFNLSLRFPHEWGTSLFGGVQSGLPYTYSQFDINGERAPAILNLDLMVYKNFDFFDMNQRVFLQILNVPNRRNVYWVYADSGKPGVDADPATSDDYTRNPTAWGPGRRIQVGISIWN